jgi:hypothetical protein
MMQHPGIKNIVAGPAGAAALCLLWMGAGRAGPRPRMRRPMLRA